MPEDRAPIMPSLWEVTGSGTSMALRVVLTAAMAEAVEEFAASIVVSVNSVNHISRSID